MAHNFLVYKVTNTINGKVYIGRTNKTLHQRKQRHYIFARSDRGISKFCSALLKYQKEVLIWEEICYASSYENSGIIEQQLIQFFNSYKIGYNSTLGGDGTIGSQHNLGQKRS